MYPPGTVLAVENRPRWNKTYFIKEWWTSYYSFVNEPQDIEKQFLAELLLRNEITHDYFNREMHLQKLIALMHNCAEGSVEVYKQLAHICEYKNLSGKYVDRNTRNK